MRSGVIAQKVGMTRIFTDAGEHVPVTVLKVDQCQVVAHRTMEKNGYTALQLGVGTRQGEERVARPSAAASPSPRSSRSRSSPSSASSEDALIPVGAEITADHFVAGQFVDVTGTTLGKGFAGGMKRWNFGGLRATHGVSVSHRSHRFDRRPPGSGQDLQEQEDGRPSRRRARDDAEPARRADRRRARPDPGRGRGSRPCRRLDLRPRRRQAEGCRTTLPMPGQVPRARRRRRAPSGRRAAAAEENA